jgi:hypothetical protein
MHSYAMAQVGAALEVGAVTPGWGVGQYTWLLVDEVALALAIADADADAGADSATLRALMVAVDVAAVDVLTVSSYFLYVTQTEKWTHR